MHDNRRVVDRIEWPRLGGYLIGAFLLIVAAAYHDTAFLIAGVFVVLVSLAGGRIKELVADKSGLRASWFEEFAKEVAEEAAKPEVTKPEPPPALPEPKRDPKTSQRSANDGLSQRDQAVATVTKSAQAQAAVVRPQDIADSQEPSELVRRLFEYVRQTVREEPDTYPYGLRTPRERLPALRGLSPTRIRAEQDLFGAILELQSDRMRSNDLGTHDAYEVAIQNEIVGWWNKPASLTDEEVVDLAGRVRKLIAHRMDRGSK